MTLCEVYREVRDKSLNVVTSTAKQAERRWKCQFVQWYCIHINFLQRNTSELPVQ